MAGKEEPKETAEKKKSLLGGSKIPLDAVLLVAAPFVTFLVLFMYVMGLLPPRPMTVQVVGATPLQNGQIGSEIAARVPSQSQAAPPLAVTKQGEEVPAVTTPEPVLPTETDSLTTEPGGGETLTGQAEGLDGKTEAPEDKAQAAPQGAGGISAAERMDRIKQLAKVYEQMNASSVAAIVSNMDEDDAVDILSNMKARNAAKVLASLEPEKAAELSLRLTEGGE
jgi:hypothetical protein